MKLDTVLKIDVTALKDALKGQGNDYSINDIKNDLISLGADVEGAKDNGRVFMYISGDVDVEDVETAFDEANVDMNDFVIEDAIDECDELNDCDAVPEYGDIDECGDMSECGIPEFDEIDVDECDDLGECYEKKQDCCPKKKVVNEDKISEIRKIRKDKPARRNVLVPLKEALKPNTKKTAQEDVPSLNGLIDHIVGKSNTKDVNEAAINKARKENGLNEGLEFLKEKLGEELYNKICAAMRNNRQSLHENITINKKKLIDYSIDELKSIYEKTVATVDDLKKKTTDGLNETDANKIQQTLELKEKLMQILSEEIEYRVAINEADDDMDSFSTDIMNLDPNKENNDAPSEEETEEKSEEKEEEKKDDDDSDNPDEDEEEEIASIVITLASKQAAEDLKADLLDEEVPEEAIEIEPVEDEKEEDEDSDEENAEEENSEESSEESSEETPAEEEKTEESVKTKGEKLNEDDEEQSADDTAADASEETSDDAASDDSENADEESDEEDAEDGAYKLILVNTDYAPELRDVLQDKWGLTAEEFADMIGGEIVDDSEDVTFNDEESEEEKKEETSDSEEEKSSEEEDKEIEDEFNPDEIFKGI